MFEIHKTCRTYLCFVLFLFNVPISRALVLYITFMLAEDAMFIQAAVLPLGAEGSGGWRHWSCSILGVWFQVLSGASLV